ncbi:MAG TPA: hydantoinase/oxoprolinase N-terminal domain-containing protein, partial [Acidimicrobiales bacterium]
MTGCFIGVDVGGTFTDVVLGDDDGNLAVAKVVTTPDDPRVGVIEGISGVLAGQGVDPGQVARVVHGTTLATNVILERRGAATAFVTTAGFGDLVRLGREFRSEEERFDLFFRPPPPPVPRRQTFELDERMTATGQPLRTPSADHVESVAAAVASAGVEAVAVCLLHAYANPAHEQLVATACRRLMPGAFVIASSEVWPELREYDRAMTTLMCAYVGPVMAR